MSDLGNQVANQVANKETTETTKLTQYEVNPFKEEFQRSLKTKKVVKKTASGITQTVYTDKDGAKFNAATLYTTEFVDDAKFIKVFSGGYRGWYGLDKATTNTLAIVMAVYQDEFDRDFIYIPFSKAQKVYEKLGIPAPKAKSTFSKGLKKLAEAGFIAKSKLGESLWWINPTLIFNGDRLVLAQQYIRQDKEKAQAIDTTAVPVEEKQALNEN